RRDLLRYGQRRQSGSAGPPGARLRPGCALADAGRAAGAGCRIRRSHHRWFGRTLALALLGRDRVLAMPPPSGLVKRRSAAPIWIALALLLLVLAGLVVITARVVLGTPQGIVLALRVVGAVLPVDIQAQGPTGRLNERFGLQRLTIEFGRAHVLIDDLRAQFDALELRPLRIRLAVLR